MKNNWTIFLLMTTLILCTRIGQHDCAVTKEQMEKTGKLFRQVCQPKHKLSDDVLDNGRNGVFPDTKNFKCYINCLLDMMQVTKRGKISYEKSLKQIDQLLPDELKPAFRNGLEMCKDSASGIKDQCESAYVLLLCFIDNNPEFMLP
ncbi:general odorant-binding protein 72-like [Armigeres subalbatus]|uniref:general odorant-binding protein 72-like n=1 Tax=Armigeres subalbatus TaxID=124917 RepID=UPI002ED05769